MSLSADPREEALGCRRGAGSRPVRGRPARPHRGRAGLEGAQVRQAAPALRPDRRHGRAAVPGRARGLRARRARRHDEELRPEGGRVDLQGPRPQEDRGREAPPRRPLRDRDPPDLLRGVGQPAHARLGALHPRPDADHVAAHPRHRQGGPADRRPLAREGPPLHPPLQLPAVLGRGDGADDRARAAATSATVRSPSGRSRRSSRTRPTSRTRSASSPRRSSRTAPRRWARSAARRSR